jgi:ERCC4-type nuclease
MKIIIDERETELYEKCVNLDNESLVVIQKEVLHIGDISIKSNEDNELCIIERKSLQDLLSSIKDGRYEEQSHRLIHASDHHTHNIIYIIEGMMSTIKEKKLIYSSITSLNYYKGFSVLRTNNIQETADLIMGMAKKMEKNSIKNIQPLWNTSCSEIAPPYTSVVKKVKKENVTIENISEIMLCQIPGISTVISRVIVQKYKSIKELLIALQENSDSLVGLTYELKGKERKISSAATSNIKKYLLGNV